MKEQVSRWEQLSRNHTAVWGWNTVSHCSRTYLPKQNKEGIKNPQSREMGKRRHEMQEEEEGEAEEAYAFAVKYNVGTITVAEYIVTFIPEQVTEHAAYEILQSQFPPYIEKQ